jgi:hypothetical protein
MILHIWKLCVKSTVRQNGSSVQVLNRIFCIMVELMILQARNRALAWYAASLSLILFALKLAPANGYPAKIRMSSKEVDVRTIFSPPFSYCPLELHKDRWIRAH